MAITDIEELRELLEGATITKIDKSNQLESLFDLVFVRDDQEYEATLYATELGWWVDRIAKREGDVVVAEDLNFFSLVSDHAMALFKSNPSRSDNPLQPIWDSGNCEIHCKVTGQKWRFQNAGEHYFDQFTEDEKGLEVFTELLWLVCQDKDIPPSAYSGYRQAWSWLYWQLD